MKIILFWYLYLKAYFQEIKLKKKETQWSGEIHKVQQYRKTDKSKLFLYNWSKLAGKNERALFLATKKILRKNCFRDKWIVRAKYTKECRARLSISIEVYDNFSTFFSRLFGKLPRNEKAVPILTPVSITTSHDRDDRTTRSAFWSKSHTYAIYILAI